MIERSLTVDVLKVAAAQLIVWHHFSAYGPMADTMTLMWPQFMDWLYRYARLAVQVFLVIGGYLAAQSVMQQGVPHPLVQITKRYLRLIPVYTVALLVISMAVAASRNTIGASWLPNEPTLWQFAAHGFLIHDLLGFEALSSGAWYVAIDFQLYVLLILLCHLLQNENNQRVSLVVALLCIASMWQFNRVDTLDIWAIYFFASYGLGVLAAWAKRSAFDMRVFWVTTVMGLGALWFEYRTRLTLALLTAIWLVTQPKGLVMHWTPFKQLLHRLSNSAYVLFLIHFGVIVLFSDMWNKGHFYHPIAAFALTSLGWLMCVGVGLFLHEKAEVPLQHWLAQRTSPLFSRLSH